MHSLQVIRFIVLVNVNLPDVLVTFVGHLEIATGNMEEIEDLLPDIFYLAMLDDEDFKSVRDEITMDSRFENEGGFSSPFIGVHYRKALSMIFAVAFVISIMTLARKFIFKNSICYSRVMKYLKEAFIFNGILRTLIEVYIELLLAFCLNTLNLLFINQSVIVLSILCMFFGLVVILLPFLSHSAIIDNYKHLSEPKYHKKYAVLIEEFWYDRGHYHSVYYVMLMMQRIAIAGTLVYFQSSPVA